MLVRRQGEIQRRVADEQDKILFPGCRVAFQRLELRLQAALRQQHLQQQHTCQRSGVAENFARLFQWLAVREENTAHFAQGRHGDAVQNIIAVVQQRFDHADEGGIKFIAAQHLGQLGRRGVTDLVFEPPRQRHGIERLHRADAKGRERLLQAKLTLAVHGDLVAFKSFRDEFCRFRRGHAELGN